MHYFNKSQCGFCKQRSTIDQIMRLADDAHKAVNNREYTVALMLDLEKAFNLVWHDGLLHKMEKMGLKGNILNFVTDFLANRSIRVRVGVGMSNSYQRQNGTPQGSVISPLLFLIMVNDIEEPSNGVRLSLYADDSATWKSGPNLTALIKDIQRFLDRLTEFFDRWGFKLSVAKTEAIEFTRNRKFRPDDVQLNIGGSVTKVQKTVRFLGVVFDRALTWSAHVDYIVAQCSKRLNLLKAIAGKRWGASRDVQLIVYKALIRSVIDYGCTAYDTACDSTKTQLEVIQSKALRICCGSVAGTPISALQVQCGQLSIALRRLRMISNYAIKIKSVPDHPTLPILDDCWQNHYTVYADGQEPFGVKATKVFNKSKIHEIPTAQSITAPWIQAETAVNRNYFRPSYMKVRDYITDLWQERWDYNDTGDFYRELQPTVSYKIKRLMPPRHKDVQITRLRFGHVKLGEKNV